jgi:hypothetical protein
MPMATNKAFWHFRNLQAEEGEATERGLRHPPDQRQGLLLQQQGVHAGASHRHRIPVHTDRHSQALRAVKF